MKKNVYLLKVVSTLNWKMQKRLIFEMKEVNHSEIVTSRWMKITTHEKWRDPPPPRRDVIIECSLNIYHNCDMRDLSIDYVDDNYNAISN